PRRSSDLGRPRTRHPAHLPTRPVGRGGAARGVRAFLEQCTERLQGARGKPAQRGGFMTTGAEATSVRLKIVVDVPIERAFHVFTNDFGSFKPREHNLLAVPIAETVLETRVGGHIYDRGVDGSECRWARVLAYEPPNRVVFSWNISPRWQLERDASK